MLKFVLAGILIVLFANFLYYPTDLGELNKTKKVTHISDIQQEKNQGAKIGDIIRSERKKRNMSRTELAQKVGGGINEQDVIEFEKNITTPNFSTKVQIESILGCSF